MTFERFAILAICSVVVSIPVIRFVPRARASVLFDRLLWVATPIVAFLAGWVAVAFTSNINLAILNGLSFADTPVLVAFCGALFGALALNLPLWLVDRYEPTDLDDQDDFK